MGATVAKSKFAALILLAACSPAIAKEQVVPPEPATHPAWADIAGQGRDKLVGQLIDPSSAKIVWTSGFQWGFIKPIIGKRTYGWIACGTLNAKNRLGGYVGAEGFVVFTDTQGAVTATYQSAYVSTCDGGPFVPTTPELVNFDGSSPSASAPAQIGVAEELKGLADLRDKGEITQAEFDTQKAKLLAR